MKPSERIEEIGRKIIKDHPHLYPGGQMNGIASCDLRLECISRYLDEEAEKKCQHDFIYMSEGDGVGDALRAVERCRYCGEKKL